MAVLERYLSKTLSPVHVKNEDEIRYRSNDKRQIKGPFQIFSIAPELTDGKRRTVDVLAKDDVMSAIVHKIAEGGENDLHCHRAQDEVWVVLEGQITFYGEDHQEIARLNPRDGLFLPRGAAYWFASTGTEAAVLLRVSATHPNIPNERWDYGKAFDPAVVR
ncbi:MAG TPA: cupin domain-containing protein [Chloroflexota bacterium]|jgi:mannose-6-phosphate isomerase-like protein (cupin superfamily)|nr:cupin domain-containing protein [Chloroflexota bacterium]